MRLFESLVRDLDYALRGIRRTPIVTGAAVLSLALGIGANTAIFSLINALMLRALPVRSPQELVQIGWLSKKWPQRFVDDTWGRGVTISGQNVALPFSFNTYELIRKRTTTLSGVAGRMDLFSKTAVMVARGRADAVRGNLVSGNFFDVLGVHAAAGRLFADSDDREGAEPVAVLSYSYWTRAFAADPRVIGTTALINGANYTIVGVTAAGFTGVVVGGAPDVYFPLHFVRLIMARDEIDNSDFLHAPGRWWVEIIGRRKPRVTEAQAGAELKALFLQSLRPIGSEPVKAEDYPALVVGSPDDIQNGVRTQFSKPLLVLMTMVGFVLLIACANVANLLLARAVARRKEMATRQALGAKPGRLFAQAMVESVLLSSIGGALGLAIAHWGTGVLLRLVSSEANPLTLDVRADSRVVMFLCALSFVVAVLFGSAPALQASRVDVNSLLKASAGEQGRFAWGRTLVILQIAVSLAMLIGAGLYSRTLWNLKHIALGFSAENVLVFHVPPKRAGYDGESFLSLVDRISERIAAIPGVRGAAYSSIELLGQLQMSGPVRIVGEVQHNSKSVLILFASPGFLENMQIPLIAGRTLGKGDAANAPRVAIANEAFAGEYFHDASPVGRQVTFWVDKYQRPMEIVGVVQDAKYTSVTAPIKPVLYLPYAQNLGEISDADFTVRAWSDPRAIAPAIREVVRRIDPNLPVFGMTTQSTLRDENLRDQILLADLAAAFANLIWSGFEKASGTKIVDGGSSREGAGAY